MKSKVGGVGRQHHFWQYTFVQISLAWARRALGFCRTLCVFSNVSIPNSSFPTHQWNQLCCSVDFFILDTLMPAGWEGVLVRGGKSFFTFLHASDFSLTWSWGANSSISSVKELTLGLFPQQHRKALTQQGIQSTGNSHKAGIWCRRAELDQGCWCKDEEYLQWAKVNL